MCMMVAWFMALELIGTWHRNPYAASLWLLSVRVKYWQILTCPLSRICHTSMFPCTLRVRPLLCTASYLPVMLLLLSCISHSNTDPFPHSLVLPSYSLLLSASLSLCLVSLQALNVSSLNVSSLYSLAPDWVAFSLLALQVSLNHVCIRVRVIFASSSSIILDTVSGHVWIDFPPLFSYGFSSNIGSQLSRLWCGAKKVRALHNERVSCGGGQDISIHCVR